MGRLLTTRRVEWMPGLAILGTSAGISVELESDSSTKSQRYLM